MKTHSPIITHENVAIYVKTEAEMWSVAQWFLAANYDYGHYFGAQWLEEKYGMNVILLGTYDQIHMCKVKEAYNFQKICVRFDWWKQYTTKQESDSIHYTIIYAKPGCTCPACNPIINEPKDIIKADSRRYQGHAFNQ